MKILNNLFFKRIFYIFFIFLILGYIFLIYLDFKNALNHVFESFGYLDNQHHWRLLDDFVNLKMPFRDYFIAPSHGWFYLLIQSPIYLLFKKNFLGELAIRHLYLPLLGIILSYFVAKNILKNKYLIFLFLFFCLFFKTNWAFESPRHLFAELSLSFFIIFLGNNNPQYLLISGLVGGLTCLISFEYGIALNMTMLFIFLVTLFLKTKVKKRFLLIKFFLGEIFVLFPFFLFLLFKGILGDFWRYTYGWINNFYYASPAAGEGFPRLSEVNSFKNFSKILIFGIPIEFLKRLNFYLVFSSYIIILFSIFICFIKKKKLNRNNLISLTLVIYALLIFIRTLDTPAIGYFSYGLIPFFLLVIIELDKLYFWLKRKNKIIRAIGFLGGLFVFFWFGITGNNNYVEKIFSKQKQEEKKLAEVKEGQFYPPAGWEMDKNLVKSYQEISDFILKNTNESDYIYVYPWGPYNQITQRKNPNSIPTTINFLAGDYFLIKTKMELEERKPKLVIINVYNNLGVANYGKKRFDVPRYFSLDYEDGPVFAGEGNIIEKFILENYEAVFANKVGIVMKQREKPISIKMGREKIFIWEPEGEGKIELGFMEKKDETNYKVKNAKATWTLVLDKPMEVMDVEIEFKIDGDFLSKHFSRYFLKLYALNEKGEKVGETKVLARKIWQTEKIYLPKPEMVKSVKIEIGENTGLLWWLHPYNLAVKKVIFYE